jgi:putative endonuclease
VGLPGKTIAVKEAALNLGAHTQVDRTARGRTGEQVAASFLIERGYRVLAKNQRTPLGEIDLVCLDGGEVVIVEVKARFDDEYGSALEAIGPRKSARLRAAAVWWLAQRASLPSRLRFDAVVVELDGHGLPRTVQHLKDIIGG